MFFFLLLLLGGAAAQCDRFLFVTNQAWLLLSAKPDAVTGRPVCYAVQDMQLAEPLDCAAHGVTRVVGFRAPNLESALNLRDMHLRPCCPSSDFKAVTREQLSSVGVCGCVCGATRLWSLCF